MPASLAKTRSLALPFLYYPHGLKADEDIHSYARPGLLVKSEVASHPRRISSLRIFRGTRAIDRKATAVPGSARLHVHPTTDILPRYISPEIEWEFVGIDERWREGVKVVFRKRPDVVVTTETRMYRELQSPHCASRFERSRTSCLGCSANQRYESLIKVGFARRWELSPCERQRTKPANAPAAKRRHVKPGTAVPGGSRKIKRIPQGRHRDPTES